MDQYSEKYSTQNNSKTVAIHNNIGKKAVQLMDNRPMSIVQQKLADSKKQLLSPLPIQKKLSSGSKDLDEDNNETTEKDNTPVQLQAITNSAKNNTVIQLGRTKSTKRKTSDTYKVKKDRKFDYNPSKKYHDLKNTIVQKVNTSMEYIKKVKKQLDDDDDINMIDSYIDMLIDIKIEAKEVLKKILELPAPKGNLRSQTVDRDNLEAELNGYNHKVGLIKTSLKMVFPMNAGGFGAKGRAHNMNVDINPKKAPVGILPNNHYFQGITLDNKVSAVKVYKESAIAPKEKSGPLDIQGLRYQKNQKKINKKAKLKLVDSTLYEIQNPQPKTFHDTPVGKNRDDGQYKSMNNTNAAGYAWLLDMLGNQRWEWLHIRGAGLGGTTNSTNLVAGTRDANTHMIPFESNIRHLGTAVKNNPKKYSRLDVVWSATGRIAKHAYNWIHITWSLYKTNGQKQATGAVNFQPLHTGSNISKKEVEKLEEILSDIRKGL